MSKFQVPSSNGVGCGDDTDISKSLFSKNSEIQWCKYIEKYENYMTK